MKKLLIKGLVVPLIGLLAGCASNNLVPKTVVTGDFKNGTFRVEAPKDLKANTINVLKHGTNVEIMIQGIETRMNPEVIGASGQAQADALNAVGDKVLEGVKTGASLVKP